jgi:hypothetical protein
MTTLEAEWTVPTAPEQSRPKHRIAALFALWWLARSALTATVLFAALAIFSTAFPLPPLWRLAIAVVVVIALPLLLRRWIRRLSNRAALGWWFLAGTNLVFCALLCQSCPDAVGQQLHDEGGWWLGEVDGWFPRRYRRATGRLGKLLQGDVRPAANNNTPRQPRPQRPQQPPPKPPKPPEPEKPITVTSPRWRPPVANLRTCLPRRTPRCRRRPCFVELRCPESAEITAAAAGVVVAVSEDHVAIEHADGEYRSEYHRLSPRSTIALGSRIEAGERLGASERLRFALGVRRGDAYRFIDPLPPLLLWGNRSSVDVGNRPWL